MRNIIDEYIPFEHKNFEYINGSLNLARQQRQSGTLEGLMASTVIYTNLVEYLANNLVENLHQMVFLMTYHSFHGVFFVKTWKRQKAKTPKMLGQLRETLGRYEFPDSTDFISLIQKFSETRNAIFHRLLTLPAQELDGGVVDQQFTSLRDLAEEILDKYNAITKGIAATWRNAAIEQPKNEETIREQLTAQIAALQSQLTALDHNASKGNL